MVIQENRALQNVEPYKRENIFQAFMSVQALGAVACMLFFWQTIYPFDSEHRINQSAGQKLTDLRDAEDIIQRAQALKPMVLLKEGKRAEAMNAANAMLKAQGHTDALANLCVGEVFVSNNVIDDGLRCLKNGVALSHRNKYATRFYAQKLAQTGKNNEAITQYQNILKVDPRWEIAHLELAQLFMNERRNREAAEELKAVVEVNDKNFAARKLRGIALGKSGDLKGGLNDYVMATAQENQHGIPDILRPFLGPQGNNAIQRAIYELQQQTTQRPDDYLPKLRLAQLFSYGGNPKDAKELLIDARRISPNNPEVYRTLAIVQKQLGEEDAAISSFGLSIKLEDQAQKAKNPQAEQSEEEEE
jgi:predicted Zn-dependent protease